MLLALLATRAGAIAAVKAEADIAAMGAGFIWVRESGVEGRRLTLRLLWGDHSVQTNCCAECTIGVALWGWVRGATRLRISFEPRGQLMWGSSSESHPPRLQQVVRVHLRQPLDRVLATAEEVRAGGPRSQHRLLKAATGAADGRGRPLRWRPAHLQQHASIQLGGAANHGLHLHHHLGYHGSVEPMFPLLDQKVLARGQRKARSARIGEQRSMPRTPATLAASPTHICCMLQILEPPVISRHIRMHQPHQGSRWL